MEYYLKPQIINIVHIDSFAGRGVPQFMAGAVFMWIIYEKTEEETKIKDAAYKNTTSITEISFCLN